MTSTSRESDVSVVCSDVRSPDDSSDVVVDLVRMKNLAMNSLLTEGASGELTLTFIDRAEMADLNAEHMGISGPTDVLSFPLDDTPNEGVPVLLGDVVISPAVAGDQAHDHAGAINDELALLVVHGVLHVLGHDHAEPNETALMRARELALLEQHHWGGPAPDGFRHTHPD